MLPEKQSGEIVTAEDWNKLTALFLALNQNAVALDSVRQVAETNEANIATIALGAIPDRSISAIKLEVAGATKQVYQITTDTQPKEGVVYYTVGDATFVQRIGLTAFDKDTPYYELNAVYVRTEHEAPQPDVTYYIYENGEEEPPEKGEQGPEGVYISQPGLEEFATGVIYYELLAIHQLTVDAEPQTGKTYYTQNIEAYVPHEGLTNFDLNTIYYTLSTVSTKAAIAEAEVIEDGIIPGSKLQENTLSSGLFTDLIIGGLLNDKTTVYTDKYISGSFTGKEDANADINETRTHTITFEKEHKALLVINSETISLFMADPNKPDITFGINYSSSMQRLCVKTRLGDNKQTARIQTDYEIGSFTDNYVAANPLNLAHSDRVCLINAYYDGDTKTLTAVFKRAGERVNQNASLYGYGFGSLIIGL